MSEWFVWVLSLLIWFLCCSFIVWHSVKLQLFIISSSITWGRDESLREVDRINIRQSVTFSWCELNFNVDVSVWKYDLIRNWLQSVTESVLSFFLSFLPSPSSIWHLHCGEWYQFRLIKLCKVVSSRVELIWFDLIIYLSFQWIRWDEWADAINQLHLNGGVKMVFIIKLVDCSFSLLSSPLLFHSSFSFCLCFVICLFISFSFPFAGQSLIEIKQSHCTHYTHNNRNRSDQLSSYHLLSSPLLSSPSPLPLSTIWWRHLIDIIQVYIGMESIRNKSVDNTHTHTHKEKKK